MCGIIYTYQSLPWSKFSRGPIPTMHIQVSGQQRNPVLLKILPGRIGRRLARRS